MAARAGSREDGGVGGNRCRRVEKWGKGKAGLPRDTPDVLEAARRLLVKARKRGVEVSESDFENTTTSRRNGYPIVELEVGVVCRVQYSLSFFLSQLFR